MKTLILYKSKNGATKDYAEYLHSQIGESEIYDVDSFDVNYLHNYKKVIIGSAIYAGQILALEFITKNWKFLSNNDVYVFTVGMLDPDAESSRITYESIPEQIKKNIRYIKVPGRIENRKLNFIEKLMVRAVKAPLIDKFDINRIKPVLDYAKG